MVEYKVSVPMRMRYADGARHEGTSFYEIVSHSVDLAKREGARQATVYLRQLQVNKSIVGWYIHGDKIEAYDSKGPAPVGVRLPQDDV